ncbi:MAG: hypothetical protein KF863_21580 [Rubrivivax sp.]|nr:hypothetical protein [Rubrivivax sp.]
MPPSEPSWLDSGLGPQDQADNIRAAAWSLRSIEERAEFVEAAAAERHHQLIDAVGSATRVAEQVRHELSTVRWVLLAILVVLVVIGLQ